MGILKNTKNVFTRYKNPYVSMERRFVLPERTSRKRENAINKAYESPTFLNILKYINAVGLRKVKYLENNITGLLDRFTDDKISLDEIKKLEADILARNKKTLKSISYEDRDKMTITLHNGRVIEAERLSHKYPKIAEYYPGILTIDTRKGRCHYMSMAIASGLSDEAVMATGTMYTTTPRAKYLHTWVEEEDNGETYCYDFTYNLSLKKEDYYYLFHTLPYEKITAKQYDEDLYQIMKLLDADPIHTKLYMSSRTEALKKASTLPDKDYSKYHLDFCEDYEKDYD